MRNIILTTLLLLPSSASAGEETWSEQRLTREEVRASKELSAIQERIDSGDLPKVQFDLDSDKVREESFAALNLIADLLLRNPKLKLRISAHTCTLGGKEYNIELSRRRARSVKEYLVKQGVLPPSVQYRGMGFSEPIADNATEEGRVKNRRVEFRIAKHDWRSVW